MENKKNKVRNENYYKIAGWMVNELNLKSVPLMVYAIIYGFSQDGESEYSGNRQYLCDFTGTTKPTIDKALKELCDSNLIIKISETKNSITFNKYKVNLDVLDFTTSKETLPVSDKEILSVGSKETLPNNDILDNNNINNNDLKEKYKKENFNEILDYWNTKKLTVHKDSNDIMKESYQKALKNFTNEQIKIAIDHYDIMYKDDNCWVENKYSLATFLSQKNLIINFIDGGTWWETYIDKKSKPKTYRQANGVISEELPPDYMFNDNNF